MKPPFSKGTLFPSVEGLPKTRGLGTDLLSLLLSTTMPGGGKTKAWMAKGSSWQVLSYHHALEERTTSHGQKGWNVLI